MGCTSCGQKRRNAKYTSVTKRNNKTGVTADTLKSIRNRGNINMRTVRSSKGVEVLRSKPSKIINELTATNRKVNMLNPAVKGRYIYLVGYKSNCSECQYLKGMLERLGGRKRSRHAQIWALEAKNADLSTVPFQSLPMVYLVEDGEMVLYFSGFEKGMDKKIKRFLYGQSVGKAERNNDAPIEVKNKKVYLLDPDPTLTDAYQKFLEEMDDDDVDRISTFMDPSTNKLVVTVIYNTP
jgi:hypothetical protein